MRSLRSMGTHREDPKSRLRRSPGRGVRFSMHETIQEASPNSKEPMRKRWQIAWVHNGDAGGAKRFAFEMVRTLAARGHVIDEFTVSTSSPNRDYLPLKPFVRTSTEIVIGRPDVSWLRPFLLSSYAELSATLWTMHKSRHAYKELANVINTRSYDFVHIEQFIFCQTLGIIPYLRKPSVVYIHEASGMRYQEIQRNAGSWQGRLRGWYSSLCGSAKRLSSYALNRRDIAHMKLAHLALTNSYYSKEIFYERYGRHASVCYCGVDTHTFRPAPVLIKPMLLSIGRMVRAKQHHLVIEAVGRIDRLLRPQVVVATPEYIERVIEPQYIDELHRLEKEHEVDVRVIYRPSQQELVNLYNEAMAVVFVPVMEPFGLVALEAMACGTPVIGVREAGIRESVVDGVTGILVDRDTAQIAAAITQLLQHEERRSQMSKQGVDHVRAQWTWEHAADRYEEEVRKALKI